MPQASKAVQEAKTALESRAAGNLKKEVREFVVEQLQLLLTLVMSLTESRSRLRTEIESMRAKYARSAEISAIRYARLLESKTSSIESTIKEFTAKQVGLQVVVEELKKENQDSRRDFLDSTSRTIANTYAEVCRVREHLPTAPLLEDLSSQIREFIAQPKMAYRPSEDLTLNKDQESGNTVSRQPGPRTFAQVATNPKYTLLIESVDPRHTGDQIIKEVKSGVDVVSMGIGITGLRKCKDSRVAISVSSEGERSKLKEALKTSCNNLTISTPRARNPLLKLIGVTHDMTDAKVMDALIKQNGNLLCGLPETDCHVRVVRRVRGRNGDSANVVVEVSPKMWARLKDQRLKMGYAIVSAFDQSPIMQCFKCMGFAHRASECKAITSTCGYCQGDHDTRNCPNRSGPPSCKNCKDSSDSPKDFCHPAYSMECKEWQKWDRISRLAVSYC